MFWLNPNMVLDWICIRARNAMMVNCVCWSIGKRKDVVAELALEFPESEGRIDEVVDSLIEDGFLTVDPVLFPNCSDPKESRLGITHDGWRKWPHFGEHEDFEVWGMNDMKEWLAWNGTNVSMDGFEEVFRAKPTKVKNVNRSIFDNFKPSVDQG